MGLFSISEEESKYFDDKGNFIEVVSCPIKEKFCTDHLDFINEKLRISRTYRSSKEFPQAIEEIRKAYYKTAEINSPVCLRCAELFRSTIIKSLEATQEDLRSMTTGFFKAKRYKSDFEFVSQVIDELKKGTANSESV